MFFSSLLRLKNCISCELEGQLERTEVVNRQVDPSRNNYGTIFWTHLCVTRL